MTAPDIVNGLYECLGGFFIGMSVIKLHREKLVRGISWPHAAFFATWGYWNLYFYPHLDQWLSFWGGVVVVATNTYWLGQIVYYNHRQRRAERELALVNVPVLATPFSRSLADDAPLNGKRYRHVDK